jgi:anti-sigma regulatory factor (Ser/Thr protein kinase)
MSGYGYPNSLRSASGRRTRPRSQWPLSNVMPPLAALLTAPGYARTHVRAALLAWDISSLAEVAELVATELITNAVRASKQPGRSRSWQDGQCPTIGICLLADGPRLRIEVWDQATGFPVLRETSVDSECGRGLALVDAMTGGRWGWCPAMLPWATKCVWAEIGQLAPVRAPTLLTPALLHPNPETGGMNMTTTETKRVPPAAASISATATAQELIAPDLFCKLTYRVMADDGHDEDTAERIIEQTLAFLTACARYPDWHLSPSETVDAGWHAFILHTADYAEFCDRIAGRFIHHRPNGPGGAASEQQAIGATIAAMRDAGLAVDPDLWVPRIACSQCYQGCTDDPKGA